SAVSVQLPGVTDTDSTVAEDNKNDEKGESAAPAITVAITPWKDIQAKLSGDQVVVLDLWSLSCMPCIEEFPGLVALAKKYPGRVECIATNLDYDGRKKRPPETYLERVEVFLESVGASSVKSYISSTPNEDVLQAIDAISLPTVIVYDPASGELQSFGDTGTEGGFSYAEDIEPLVEKLLGEES
ncbi:MAG: hypothetical protein AAF664_15155, partial [Planctomycetota bacterium]